MTVRFYFKNGYLPGDCIRKAKEDNRASEYLGVAWHKDGEIGDAHNVTNTTGGYLEAKCHPADLWTLKRNFCDFYLSEDIPSAERPWTVNCQGAILGTPGVSLGRYTRDLNSMVIRSTGFNTVAITVETHGDDALAVFLNTWVGLIAGKDENFYDLWSKNPDKIGEAHS